MRDETKIRGNICINDQYQLKKILGQGGMERVYLAKDLHKNRLVAIKQITILDIDANTEVLVERFQREYLFLASIDHPLIVKAYDFIQGEKNIFLVLELASGIPLENFIKKKPHSLNLKEQLAIAVQISRAIEIINSVGIIHRDIKPANIILSCKNKNVKLLDLGIATSIDDKMKRLTQEGKIIGTPEYMSPEQIGGKIAKNSDVFALAIVFYQFFLWQKTSPFKKDTGINTLMAISTQDLPPLIEILDSSSNFLAVYQKLSRILQKALIKDPKNRLVSAKAMAKELEALYVQIDMKDTWKLVSCPTNKELSRLKALGQKYGKDFAKQRPKKTQKNFSSKNAIVVIIAMVVILIAFFLSSSPQKKTKLSLKKKSQKSLTSSKKSQKSLALSKKKLYSSSVKQKSSNKSSRSASQKIMTENDIYGFVFQGQKTFTYSKITKTMNIYQHKKTGLSMVLVPGGDFVMGFRYRHYVSLSPFLISQYELTQEIWQKIMGNNPSQFIGPKNPVDSISWEDAQKFCHKAGLNLPSEAQWEYAYFMGKFRLLKENRDIYSWHSKNSGGKTHPVGTKIPNAFGLYDALGNVFEWCSDWYGPYPKTKSINPLGPEKGVARIVRGGAWSTHPYFCSGRKRDSKFPMQRDEYLGVRVAKSNLVKIFPALGKWEKQLQQMQQEFTALEKTKPQNISIWQAFLKKYPPFHPHSSKDETMRLQAQKKLNKLFLWAQRLDNRKALNIIAKLKKNISTGISQLCALQNVTILKFANIPIENKHLAQLANLTSLKKLYLENTKINSKGLVYLPKLTQLSTLSLERMNINDENLELLVKLPRLTQLLLNHTFITNRGLEKLKKLLHLRELGINYTKISDSGLRYLSSLKNLQMLRAIGNDITNQGLLHIKQIKNLEYLLLNKTKIGNKGIEHLYELPNLKRMDINQIQITNDGLFYLRKLPLSRLSIASVNIDDLGLAYLSKISTLETLILHGTKITKNGLRYLKKFPKLTYVGLGNLGLTNRGIKQLQDLSNLVTLHMPGNPIGNQSLEYLHKFKKLTNLNVSKTNVTFVGIKKLLKKLPKLRRIEIKNCLNTKEIRLLRKEFRKRKIIYK